jgi:hypothetical protein
MGSRMHDVVMPPYDLAIRSPSTVAEEFLVCYTVKIIFVITRHLVAVAVAYGFVESTPLSVQR